jgi:hypothetical protein
MSDIHSLALRQADQARTDSAAIESELEVIQKQLARLPTRRELAATALGIIFATMMLTTLSLLFSSALKPGFRGSGSSRWAAIPASGESMWSLEGEPPTPIMRTQAATAFATGCAFAKSPRAKPRLTLRSETTTCVIFLPNRL